MAEEASLLDLQSTFDGLQFSDPGAISALLDAAKRSDIVTFKVILNGPKLHLDEFKQYDPQLSICARVIVTNQQLKTILECRAAIVFDRMKAPGSPQHFYHVTKGSLLSILLEGLNPLLSSGGLFGKGIYLSTNPLKANDYSPSRGRPNDIRVMLKCSAVLGNVYDFGVGRFDKDMVAAPQGFHSVKGFVRRAEEFVVYRESQVNVEEIIFYTFGNTQLEMEPSSNVPPSVAGKVRVVNFLASLYALFLIF
jgi:hypothetical protein